MRHRRSPQNGHEELARSTLVVDAGRVPDTSTDPPAQTAGSTVARGTAPVESRRGHTRRRAHRARLYTYVIASVGLVVIVIALATANTRHVEVSSILGTSSISLIWLVIVSVLLGWLLGMVTGSFLRWRTRARSSHPGG